MNILPGIAYNLIYYLHYSSYGKPEIKSCCSNQSEMVSTDSKSQPDGITRASKLNEKSDKCCDDSKGNNAKKKDQIVEADSSTAVCSCCPC